MRDSLPFSAREMPDGVHTSKRREALLRLPIGDLVTWQLVASCSGCRADRVLFVRELVEQFGEKPTLVMLVPRLRCRVETCRRPPVRVMLRNRYPAAMGLGSWKWRWFRQAAESCDKERGRTGMEPYWLGSGA